nr:MAG TPA: hypothetical protein [Caudoviricetes sp.]
MPEATSPLSFVKLPMPFIQLEFNLENPLQSSSGKTSQECSTQKTTPSGVSWLNLLEQTLPFRPAQEDGRVQVWLPDPKEKSPGACLMLNISESPSDAVVSSLSQVLLKGGGQSIPQRYFLSAKACLGILRRAMSRGKQLPPLLKAALERTAMQAEPQAL